MQLGMIGLGRMGASALRFEFGGHHEKPVEDGLKRA
jgi:6-phosphogluconate dehydrogenase (decarboxylating)